MGYSESGHGRRVYFVISIFYSELSTIVGLGEIEENNTTRTCELQYTATPLLRDCVTLVLHFAEAHFVLREIPLSPYSETSHFS